MLTDSGQQVGDKRLRQSGTTMYRVSMRIAVALLGGAMAFGGISGGWAQSGDPKAGPPRQQSDTESKRDGQRKLDEFAEAAKVLGGPAANPECVWLGRRVV